MRSLLPWLLVVGLLVTGSAGFGAATSTTATPPPDPLELAGQVVIHRDEWGVPHITGRTDMAVAFGSAWSQCEDHFWQLEDTYIQALGRYAEIIGEKGLENDIEVAAFELVESARDGFASLDPEIQRIATGFAAGYNYYLAKNPSTKPRLLHHMEPWHVLLFERFTILSRLLGAAHVPHRRELAGLAAEQAAAVGSNQWAVGPSRTRDGSTMLFINPHQPWYGWGMFTEMHVRSDEGLDFSGSMYPGGPLPTAGFNRYLGWAYTVNEADISDVYRVTFDHPTDRLLYRYGGDWRRAEEWTVTLQVLDLSTTTAASAPPTTAATPPSERRTPDPSTAVRQRRTRITRPRTRNTGLPTPLTPPPHLLPHSPHAASPSARPTTAR